MMEKKVMEIGFGSRTTLREECKYAREYMG